MAPANQVKAPSDNGLHNGKSSPAIKAAAVINCNPNLSDQKVSIRGVVAELLAIPNPEKPLVSLGVGDASSFPCFQAGRDISKSVVDSVSSGEFIGYAPSFGIPFARRAVADYLSAGLNPGFHEKDVFLTAGGTQALQVCLTVLATSGCNVLLPKPGFPPYESACELNGIEPRYYDLLPNCNWEVDLAQVRKLVDPHTVGWVVINPNNPCGAVYSRAHLRQIAETAAELNLPIISDEVYGHMVFGGGKFVTMATLASVAPILTIGSLSKRWLVPGWRLGWVAVCDPRGSLKRVKLAIEAFMNVAAGPASIVQAAVPAILSASNEEFHSNVTMLLESSNEFLYKKMELIEALKCYSKPQGAMFLMVEIKTDLLYGIDSDMDFARELMKEESVLVLPGSVIGLKNWVRLFFGLPVDLLEVACGRIKAFCDKRQRRQQNAKIYG